MFLCGVWLYACLPLGMFSPYVSHQMIFSGESAFIRRCSLASAPAFGYFGVRAVERLRWEVSLQVTLEVEGSFERRIASGVCADDTGRRMGKLFTSSMFALTIAIGEAINVAIANVRLRRISRIVQMGLS